MNLVNVDPIFQQAACLLSIYTLTCAALRKERKIKTFYWKPKIELNASVYLPLLLFLLEKRVFFGGEEEKGIGAEKWKELLFSQRFQPCMAKMNLNFPAVVL